MKKIFLIGSINTDITIRAPYLPKRGETLTGEGFLVARGGKGANQAVAAARLGGQVVMCGCVGDDSFGKEAVESLKAEGVDVENIRTVEGVPTGSAVILVIDGDNRIVLDKGANACLSKADVDRALESAKAGDVLLAQLENPVETVGYALQRGREKGMYVVLNPAPANKEILPYLKYCDLLTPNETERDILGGEEFLRGQGKRLIVTLGSDGFDYFDETGATRVPCLPVKAVDTTGAGDTLCGGLSARLSMGDGLLEAAKYGSAAASLACTRRGAQPAIPNAGEVDEFLKGFSDKERP